MKALAINLIRAMASYGGGATTGLLVTTAAGGPVGAGAAIGLLGIVASCLMLEAVSERIAPNDRLSMIETWLHELVRRHGELTRALEAIAEGQETHRLVSKDRATDLLAILTAAPGEVDDLLDADSDASTLLDSLAAFLERLDRSVLTQLQQQAASLSTIEAGVQHAQASLGRLQDSTDRVLSLLQGPTDDELADRAIDDQDNCRLRTHELKQQLEQLEYVRAREFADRCVAWLARTTKLQAPAVSGLLEPLLDEGVVRLRLATPESKPKAIERLDHLVDMAKRTLPLLLENDALRLSSQIGYVDSLRYSTDAGLAALEGRSDPYAVRRRLAILADAGEYTKAIELVRGASPRAEWIDKAVHVCARGNAWSEAQAFVTWAVSDAPANFQRLCPLILAESALLELQGGRPPPEKLRKRLDEAFRMLQPEIQHLLTLPQPRHELDCYALRMSVELASRLGQIDLVNRLARILARRRPLDLGLAVLAANGRAESEDDWPQRLRAEGDSTFARRLIAVALEANRPPLRSRAFEAGLRLAEEAEDDEQKARLHGILLEIAQQLGSEAEQQLERISASLIQPDHRQARLWAVGRMLREGKIEAADAALEELRQLDDPLWLQIHGQLLLQRGEIDGALDDLTEAAHRLDRPDVFVSVAALAISHDAWEQGIRLLQRYLVFRPGDPAARAHLARALWRVDRCREAAAIYVALAEAEQENPNHAVHAAGCLIQAGQPDEARSILERACGRASPPLRAIVALAQILVERDRPTNALALLNRHRSTYWNEHEFVAPYWSVAVAAEDEHSAHEAFEQMRALQARGIAPSDMIVAKELDDLLKMHETHNERRRTIGYSMLQGRVPWLAVAEWNREPAYRAWDARTHSRAWLYEHPINLAESCIYGSNCFTVVRTGTSAELVPIEASGHHQPVVADLSSLIMLQQLGMLERAVAYCGRFHIPNSYLFKMFVDSDQLRPHQPSRRTLLDLLHGAIAQGRVHTLLNLPSVPAKRLDEHYPEAQQSTGVYHIADLLDPLASNGMATDEQLANLRRVSHRAKTTGDGREPIVAGDHLIVSISTLSTLQFCDLLDTVTSHFHIYLEDDDYKAIQGESLWFETQRRLRTDHRTLWEFLRDSSSVERHGRVRPSNADASAAGLALEAFDLAQELGLPLLIDDRCLQSAQLNLDPSIPSRAFGTPQLLSSLAATEHITRDRYAISVRKLIDYRFRFIAPEPTLLLHWASRAASSPPGPDLQAVAEYLHACLRDPGLLGGTEATKPPSTVALNFYQTIGGNVGEFIAALWSQSEIDEERAVEITRWSLTNLLPSPPAAMEPRIRLVEGTDTLLFWPAFLIQIALYVTPGNESRVRRCLTLVGEALGISRPALIRSTTEIIDGIFNHTGQS